MRVKTDDSGRLCIIHKTSHAARSSFQSSSMARTQVVRRDYFQRSVWSPNDHAGTPFSASRASSIIDTRLSRTIVRARVRACARSRVSASKFMRRPNSRNVTRFIRHSTSRRSLTNGRFRCYNTLGRKQHLVYTRNDILQSKQAPATTLASNHYNVISTHQATVFTRLTTLITPQSGRHNSRRLV